MKFVPNINVLSTVVALLPLLIPTYAQAASSTTDDIDDQTNKINQVAAQEFVQNEQQRRQLFRRNKPGYRGRPLTPTSPTPPLTPTIPTPPPIIIRSGRFRRRKGNRGNPRPGFPPQQPPPPVAPTPPPVPPPTPSPTASPTKSPTVSPTPEPTRTPVIITRTELEGTAAEQFGWAVSLDEDGDSIAIGAPDEASPGFVQTFQNEGIDWNQYGEDILGETEGEGAGWRVSLSGDAQRVALSSIFALESLGYVKILQFDDGTGVWEVLGSRIDGTIPGDEFGNALSLSKSGSRVAASGFSVAKVLEFQTNEWVDIGEIPDASTVALSGDGNVVAAGSPLGNNAKGFVRVYEWDGSIWVQLGDDIVGNTNDNFGWAVSLSDNGFTIAIGTFFGNYVKVFQYDGTSWNQVGSQIDGEEDDVDENGSFGFSVSISGEGNRLVAGSPSFDSALAFDAGRAAVYELQVDWVQLGDDVVGDDADNFAGGSVSISNDGSAVAVGVDGFDNARGKVVILEID